MLLTADQVMLTGVDGDLVEIPWNNPKMTRVRGRLNRTFVCELAAFSDLGSVSRIERPYEIRVSLVGVTPSVRNRGAELERRTGDTTDASATL